MADLQRILVTGASGFVGARLVELLSAHAKYSPVAVVRNSSDAQHFLGESLVLGDLARGEVRVDCLYSVDVLIHAAARVHVMHESADALVEFRRVNVFATLDLAKKAACAGVKRFIYISSIKVNGDATVLGQGFTPEQAAAPMDPYGLSKMEAEQGLRAIAVESGMEVVIIRPPLVYGPGVKANFLSMMNWLKRGIPLPFGAIHNQRSLVALDNLVDLIITCIGHSAAANQTFLVSDGEDLSTSELLRCMGVALGKPARLLPVSSRLLEIGAALLGKRALSQRLCGSLQVDISKTRELLNWSPPINIDEALRNTAKYFLEHQGK